MLPESGIWAGPNSSDLSDGWVSEASAQPYNIPIGRGDRKEQVRMVLGLRPQALLTVP